MRKILTMFKHGSLKRNILITISLLIPGSILLISGLTYKRYTDDILNQSNMQIHQLIEQVAINTDTYIDELFRLCHSPYYNDQVMQQLQYKPLTRQEQLKKKRIIEDYLREVITIPRNDILRVYILADDIYFSTKTTHTPALSGNYEDEPWYKKAVESDETVFIPVFTEKSGGYTLSVFSVVQKLKSIKDTSQVIGVIRADANYAGIKKVCDKISITEHGALFIIDSSNNIIYDHSNLPGTVDKQEVFSLARSASNSSIPARLEGEKYWINSRNINSADWMIIAVNSYDDLTKNAAVARNYMFALAILCSVSGVAIAVILVRRFLKPLYKTVDLMRLAQGGDLSVRAESCGTSEIDFLNKSFNEMLSRIQSMIERDTRLTKQVYEARYLQKEAQYDALYNQIQPHFLFNTLNTISLLVKCNRGHEAVKSIEELSVMLRGMINTDREITLEAEFKIVESYLSLQKRQHNSLSYSIGQDSQFRDYLLPALTIQPIVENAFIHGCSSMSAGAFIRVYTLTDEDYLMICIEDNGTGMDEDLLSAIRNSLEADDEKSLVSTSRGIGLVNISRRIRLKFGDEYGLKISSRLSAGTTVTVMLPIDRRV